ncbi:MAG: hypothetical protein HYT78_21520 [Deltaproteobacteria bacterium]|nr:hypothetical protein [Deltaproteobacteria bacterium]
MNAIRSLIAIGLVALALVVTDLNAKAAEDLATWKTYSDLNCGIAFRYPPSYPIRANAAKDYCALSVRVGDVFELEVEEMDNAYRRDMVQSGIEISPRSFAIARAQVRCMADGPGGSTYCTDVVKQTAFKTTSGFNGYEFYLTEVRESFQKKRKSTETRTKGPIFALDISDDEVIRVVLATPTETAGKSSRDLAMVKAILNTLRVWSKARRQAPQIVEFNPFTQSQDAFTIRVVPDDRYGSDPSPGKQPVQWFLIDPRGRRRGVDPATSASYADIPAITYYSATGQSGLMLKEPLEGRYELHITAAFPSLRYKLFVHAPDRTGKPWTTPYANRTAEAGAVHRYDVVYSKASTPPVRVSEAKDFSYLTLLLTGIEKPVSELLLTDPRGRRTGLAPAANAAYREVPRSSYHTEGTGRQAMVLDLRQPRDGSYVLQVAGTAVGRYTLDLRAGDRSGSATSKPDFRDIPIDRDVVHLYALDYSAVAENPLIVAGGFDGKGPISDDRAKLLTYANPVSAETSLPPGTTNFPLLIFYGRSIKPVTFTAMLNDTNISSRFTPAPGTSQTVLVPLRPGSNTLVLSVDGTTASGSGATDVDRLVFLVP